MKKQNIRVSRSGAYTVKAAESRPRRVTPRTDGRANTPTEADKSLVRALLRLKRGESEP